VHISTATCLGSELSRPTWPSPWHPLEVTSDALPQAARQRRAGSAVRKPTFEVTVLASTLVVVILLLLSMRRNVDDDLWLHLRIGQELRAGNGFQTTPDGLTVLADVPYVPSQWLAELGLSATYDVAGLAGIHLVRLIAIVAICGLSYLSARTATGAVLATGLTIPTAFATSAAWAERPQLLGLVLHAAVVLLWVRAWRSGKAPWLIIPIIWAWSNIHGTWILGIATGATATIAIHLDRRDRAPNRRNALVLVLSLVALGAQPFGWALVVQPFRVNDAARATVNEWQAPGLDNPTLVVVLAMIVVAVVVLVRKRSRPSWMALGLLALGAVLSVYAVRTVAFAAILVSAGLAMSAAMPKGPSAVQRRTEWVLAGLASIAVVSIGMVVATPGPALAQLGIADRLSVAPTGTTIAVQPEVSGWVLFHAPHLKPLRDLRAEAYSEQSAGVFQRIWGVKDGWQAELKNRNVRLILLKRGEPLDRGLQTTDWNLALTANGYDLWRSSALQP